MNAMRRSSVGAPKLPCATTSFASRAMSASSAFTAATSNDEKRWYRLRTTS